ncbi:hypothetical protein BDY19DRAFT_904241 [Irpex rosettiformis]|uniref:Uncharacterized protein n=1 Tax=Irpex rosettiformis TaxID=378272 RepID=A0ACB8UBM9_9APHY|nr:hypothetical protein BDY19DRAFT_904241 [Irpex rosettiformis]
MSEYVDYPPGFHIDESFGAEYDPYPGNRTRQGPGRSAASPSWLLTSNIQPPAASTPRVTPTNVTSPIPTVHRLARNPDDDPARTPVAFGSPVSGQGVFQGRGAIAAEQATMPWLTRSPTNVSYPTTMPRQTWLSNNGQQSPPMRTNDNSSLFQPIHASTPAPSQYIGDPRLYPQAPPPRYERRFSPPQQYGAAVPAENDVGSRRSPSIERGYPAHRVHRDEDEDEEQSRIHHYYEYNRHDRSTPHEVDEAEFEREMRSNSGSVSEPEYDEEVVPMDAVVDDQQQQQQQNQQQQQQNQQQRQEEGMPGMMHMPEAHSQEPQPLVVNKGKKRFVGGFWSGLKNFTGFGPKPPLPPLIIPPHAQTRPPNNLVPVETRPPVSDAGDNPPPLAINVHAPPSVSSPDRPLLPALAAADSSFLVDPTPESHGPTNTTADQSELPITIPDLPEDTHLPNPHDETHELITAPNSHPGTPEEVDLRHTVDYDAMSDPIEDDIPERTFSTHINRVGKFISDLVHLPWISPTSISEPYKPAESRRARYAVGGSKSGGGKSWYTKENHEKLDLLATPTQMNQRRYPTSAGGGTQTRPSENPRRRRPARRVRERLSSSTDDTTSFSPRVHKPTYDPGLTLASSPIVLSQRSHNNLNAQQQPIPIPVQAGPYNYYYTTTPSHPMYIYPSPIASPRAQTGSEGNGNNNVNNNNVGYGYVQGGPATATTPIVMPVPIPFQMPIPGGSGGHQQQQGVPTVYMIAPAPIVIPQTTSNAPSRQHTGRKRGGRNGNHVQQGGGEGGGSGVNTRNSVTSRSSTSRKGNGNQKSPGQVKRGGNGKAVVDGGGGTTSPRAGSRSPRPVVNAQEVVDVDSTLRRVIQDVTCHDGSCSQVIALGGYVDKPRSRLNVNVSTLRQYSSIFHFVCFKLFTTNYMWAGVLDVISCQIDHPLELVESKCRLATDVKAKRSARSCDGEASRVLRYRSCDMSPVPGEMAIWTTIKITLCGHNPISGVNVIRGSWGSGHDIRRHTTTYDDMHKTYTQHTHSAVDEESDIKASDVIA